MRHFKVFFAAVLGLGFSVGCAPSPEKVCSHYFELEEAKSKKSKDDDDDKTDEKIKKMIEKIREKKKEECPKALAIVKEEAGDAYKCFAKCVTNGKELSDIKSCDKDCEGFRDAFKKATKKLSKDDDGDKKKKGDDDDDDKKKKKKDDD